ncbi:riboflavin synthase [Patescibacteria group bacterium]|nr:riboflavin synthase [Patescibacteria group bacterium]
MYTGIIHYQATVSNIKKQQNNNILLSFGVPAQVRKRLHVDDSVLIDGVCLTVIALSKNGFSAEVMPETLLLSTLSSLKQSWQANLELSLRGSDTLGGHFVMGHVDGVGTVVKLEQDGGSVRMSIQVPKELMPYIAKKGSIAMNGVSLTITNVSQNTFEVALIPHTLAKTNLDTLLKGSTVNIEIDTFARIIGQFLKQRYTKKTY